MKVSLFEVALAMLIQSIARMDVWPQIRAHLDVVRKQLRREVAQELRMDASERAELEEYTQRLFTWLTLLRILWRVGSQFWSEEGTSTQGWLVKATAAGTAAQAVCLLDAFAQIFERKMDLSRPYWRDRKEVLNAARCSARLWLAVSRQGAEHVIQSKRQFRAVTERLRVIEDMGDLAQELRLPRDEAEAFWSGLYQPGPNPGVNWIMRTAELISATGRASRADGEMLAAYAQYKGRVFEPKPTEKPPDTESGKN